MNPYLEIILDLIYFFFYALLTALQWITYPLKPVWYLLYVFALPFLYIGQFFASAIAYPARKLPGSVVETLYIYLSTAAILGLATGLTLYLTKTLLTTMLNLSPSQTSTTARQIAKPAKRSLSQYRASRRAKSKELRKLPLTDLNRLPLTDLNLDEFSTSILSPRSLTSPSLSPTMTHSPTNGIGRGERWARKGLLSSHQTIMEEGDSDEYF